MLTLKINQTCVRYFEELLVTIVFHSMGEKHYGHQWGPETIWLLI